jgi:hypothetical protein
MTFKEGVTTQKTPFFRNRIVSREAKCKQPANSRL